MPLTIASISDLISWWQASNGDWTGNISYFSLTPTQKVVYRRKESIIVIGRDGKDRYFSYVYTTTDNTAEVYHYKNGSIDYFLKMHF